MSASLAATLTFCTNRFFTIRLNDLELGHGYELVLAKLAHFYKFSRDPERAMLAYLKATSRSPAALRAKQEVRQWLRTTQAGFLDFSA